MAQSDTLSRESVTYVMDEATFASRTSATNVKRIRTIPNELGADLRHEMLENKGETQRRHDNYQKVPGTTDGSTFFPLAFQLCGPPAASRLASGVADATLSHEVVYKHAFGRRYAASGTTISGGSSTTTSLTLASATGRAVGEMIEVEVSTGVYEVVQITALVTTTATVAPALSTAPGDAAIVRGLRGYYLAESKTGSLCIEKKFTQTSGLEYRMLGCRGTLALAFPGWSQIPTATLSGQCSAFQKETTLTSSSFGSSAVAADDMGDPIVLLPVVYLGDTIDRENDSAYRIENLEVEIPEAWETTHDGSAAHGIGGVVATGGTPYAARIKLTVRIDPAQQTAFDAHTLRQILISNQTPNGSFYLWAPRVEMIREPKLVALGARLGMELEFHCLRNTGVTLPGSPSAEQYDMGYSPLVFALG